MRAASRWRCRTRPSRGCRASPMRPTGCPGRRRSTKTLVCIPAQIQADLALLAMRTSCVRIYSVDQGLDPCRRARPRSRSEGAARRLDRPRSRRERAELELDLAIDRGATRTRSTRLIVGNEVLLRREQTPRPSLRADRTRPRTRDAAGHLRRRLGVLAEAPRARRGGRSFVTVSISCPYWEDDPVPHRDARIDTSAQRLRQVRADFPASGSSSARPAGRAPGGSARRARRRG